MMARLSTSIIICTRNRCANLLETLGSIGCCKVPAGIDVELIVVNNGSTDQTAHVVDNIGLTNMSLRCVVQPKAGKGHAYNLGIAEATGDILIFTDDDVLVPENWVDAMCRPIISGMADAVQGKIVCRLPPLPDFYDRARLGGFAEVDQGDAGIFMAEFELVGASMAFHRRCVEAVGGFNTLLGPGRSGFFDDTEFSWRLQRAGFRAWYSPEAPVVHCPGAARITRGSLRREWFRHGRSSFVANASWGNKSHSGGITLSRRLLRNIKLKVKQLLAGNATQVTQDEMFLWMQLGHSWARFRGLPRIARSMREPLSQPPDLIAYRNSTEKTLK